MATPAPDSGLDSGFAADTSAFAVDAAGPEPGAPAASPGAAPDLTTRIAWRRRVLLLAAIMGCLGVFLLARALANGPHIAVDWRSHSDGVLEVDATTLPELKSLRGQELAAIAGPDGRYVAYDVLAMTHTSRWIARTSVQQQLERARLAAAQALAAGSVALEFRDGTHISVPARPRGYGGLGTLFWLMSAFALVVYLVGWIVPLVQTTRRNMMYGVMAMAQASQLLLSAVASVPALALPAWLVMNEPELRTLLDAITGASVVSICASYPHLLPGRRGLTALVWLATLAYGALALNGGLVGDWWWSEALLLGEGLLCVVLLGWSGRRAPHPFVTVMRRFAIVTLSTLALLSLAVSLMPLMPTELRPAASAGTVIWSVFLASVVLLMPFIARSQHVMREFAMLAGISTLATSMDLLFVAVFSFSQFTSLTLSLFLALGAYAAVRQWLVTQMMGARALTTERMFEHLYRIAREVEARPERAGERMTELLRNVFEPLETLYTDGQGAQSRISGNGAVLLVPLPNLVHAPKVKGMVALRFAERGKRLFTPEDARLADRVVEQLMRAVAHDRAVERGRSEERKRIAQDLHDDIGARLLTLMYKAPNKDMENYLRHTLQDLKTLTRGLAAKNHPLALAAAEWKTDVAQRLAAVGCELDWRFTQDQDVMLSMVQWSSLTRVLRELVSNVLAHAQAHHVSIDGELRQGLFKLVIADDGAGRTPEKWSHGLGLGGIRKRVKSLHGSVEWQEREPRGIVCTVIVPQLVPVPAP